MNFKTSLFCEFDKYAAESYCAVHGIDPALNIGDITKADETKVPDFNTMFGGSPCQDFSIAGKLGGGQHGLVKIVVIRTIRWKHIIPNVTDALYATLWTLIKQDRPYLQSGCDF